MILREPALAYKLNQDQLKVDLLFNMQLNRIREITHAGLLIQRLHQFMSL